MKEEKEICKKELMRNIANVELGKPLTKPLAVLNRSCEFRKVWEKIHEDEIIEERKAKRREYYRKPEVKARMREYQRKKNNIPKSRWRVKE